MSEMLAVLSDSQRVSKLKIIKDNYRETSLKHSKGETE